MQYRPEIDGLRALAVLPVIAFHAGSTLFSGGYVGVDVFFVISGYLITSIIAREMSEARFTLAGFYARRARRILPALTLVCVASAVMAYALMTPSHLQAFGESLLATQLFISNIHFWQDSGYFAQASELKPLLHTWSLAIEEQFYVLFPLVMMALFARSRRALHVILTLGWALSFALALYASRAVPDANFYLLPTRAFELLTGAMLALTPRFSPKARAAREAGATLGLLAILAAMIAFNADTNVPGPAALLPVLGTALVIACARHDTAIGRVLSAPALVTIGLISYSAYLWHWPLFVFARLYQYGGGPAPNYLLLSVATLVLAWLSWKFIETPFRRPQSVPPMRAAILLGAPILALAAFSIAAISTSGFQDARSSPRITALEASATFSPRRADCHTGGHDYRAPENACTYFSDTLTWASFGDSHTVELSFALARDLEPYGEGISHHSFSNCAPMAGRGAASPCARWTQETLDYLIAHPRIDTVIVSYRIHNYLWGDHLAHYPHLPDAYSPARRRDVWQAYLAAITQLSDAGKRVVVVLQAPELPAPVSYMVRRTPQNGQIPGISRDWWDTRRAFVSDRLEDMPTNVIIIDPTELFCDADTCITSENDTFLYFDTNHLSVSGMDRVAAEILANTAP